MTPTCFARERPIVATMLSNPFTQLSPGVGRDFRVLPLGEGPRWVPIRIGNILAPRPVEMHVSRIDAPVGVHEIPFRVGSIHCRYA